MRLPAQTQADLVRRTSMRRADLFVLTTYINRDTQEVDAVYYWSDASRRYDYNRTFTVREFEPVVRTRSGPDAQNMTHISDFGGGHAQTVEIVCANRPTYQGGKYLIEQLREGALFRATIEVSELLIRGSQDEVDLTNLPGDEHVVVFRGELAGPVKISEDTFTLQFQSVEPKVPWKYATGSTVDIDDAGKRLPVIYGRMPRVECVGIDVGGESTLAASLALGASDEVFVSDISRFQNSGIVYVEGERITYSGRNTSLAKLTGTNRASPREHTAGAHVLEIRESTFAVAGHAVAAINDIYVRHPDGVVVKLPSASTTTTVGEVVGDYGTIATVRLSAAQFEAIVTSFEEQTPSEITQQPTVSQQSMITTLRIAEIGHGTDETVAGWEMTSMVGFNIRAGYAKHRAVVFSPTPEDLLGLTNSATYWDITLAGGPNGNEPITSPAPAGDLEFFVACGVGEGVLDYTFASTRYSTAERDAGAGAKQFSFFVGPFVVPGGGGSLDAFTVRIDFSDVPLSAPDLEPPDAINNRMYVGAVATLGAHGAYFTNAPPQSWALFAGITTTTLFEEIIETDIAVAGNDGSIVKGTTRTRRGAARLKLYADTDGVVLSGVTPIEEAPAILQHFIVEFCGQTLAADQSYDVATNNSSLNTGGFRKHAMDVRSLGTGFAQILGRMAWEMRSNMIRLEGQVTQHTPFEDHYRIEMAGTDEWLSSLNYQDIGIANAWSISFVMLSTTETPGINSSIFIAEAVPASDVNAIRIFRTSEFEGLCPRVKLWSSSGVLFKDYTFPGSGTGWPGFNAHVLSWDGTNLRLFVDGVERPVDDLAPFHLDNSGTMTATNRRIRIGAFDSDADPWIGYFGHAAVWSTAINGAAENARLAEMISDENVIGGVSLTTNNGAYVSSSSLKHWFRPGFASGGSYEGDTYLRDEVSSGSISITDDASYITEGDDLVGGPTAGAAVAGSTYYGLRCASNVAERFRFGFPFSTSLPEDQTGVGTLDQYTSSAEVGRDPETIKTRFRALYGWDATRGGPTDPNALRYAVQAGPVGNALTYPSTGDFAEAERRFGRRDEDTLVLLTIQNVSTAADTLAWLAHTALLDTRTWEFGGVPWEIAYLLEPGDTIIVPETPWAPRDAWFARVLGIARDNDSGLAGLTLLGVSRRDAFLGAGTIAPTGAGVANHGATMAGAGVIAPTGAGVIHFRASMTGAGTISRTGSGVVVAVVRAGGSGSILGTIEGLGGAFFTI
jgi:hypothetical protein